MVRFKALARCLKLNCCCFDMDAELSRSLIKREPYESSSLTFKTTALMTNYILLHSITLNVIYIYIYIYIYFFFFVLCTIETLYIFLFLDFFTNLVVVRVNIDTSAATNHTLKIQIL